MKVLLLGATGRTGKLILEQLIQQGHTVNIIVRNKATIKISSDILTIFEGDVQDEQLLNTAMLNCDAVISALNISRNSDFPWSALRTPIQFLSKTITAVIKVAKAHNMNRLIVLSAWGVAGTKAQLPVFFRWLIDHSNIGPAYQDHELQEALLALSKLNWTAIRPVGLTNFAAKPIKVIVDSSLKPGWLISRKTVARYAVDILEKNSYLQQTPTVFE